MNFISYADIECCKFLSGMKAIFPFDLPAQLLTMKQSKISNRAVLMSPIPCIFSDKFVGFFAVQSPACSGWDQQPMCL